VVAVSLVESLDFSEYDLVISSSSGLMKGIIVPSKVKHICYLHTSTRWALQDAKQKRNLLKRIYIHFFRIWDYEATQRPDMLIANSEYTKRRIEKYYRRETRVIYPAVEVKSSKFQVSNFKNYFIVISRLSFYKHIDWAIEAFKNLPYNLVIVGEGPEDKKLKRKAHNMEHKTENIFFAGFIEERSKLYELMKNSIGLIHLAEEDFGISMVEALKLGKPVIAYNRGGAREIVKKGISGEFFTNKHDLSDAIKKVAENATKYKPAIIKKSVEGFSKKRFEKEIMEHITHNMKHGIQYR